MKSFLLAVLIGFFLAQASCRTINQAASYSETGRVFQMVKDGADVNEQDGEGYTPLIWAARYANYPLVKFLVEHGADVNHQDSTWGFTALMYAVYYSNDPITEYLLEHGATTEHREKSGYTVLGLARRNGNEKIEKLLLEKGAKE